MLVSRMNAAYLEGADREQEALLPARVDEFISPNSLARVVDVFVDGLSCGDNENSLPPLREMSAKGGRRGYHPRALAKLLIWGYLKRVRSTRRLEEAAVLNLEAIWLLNTLKPDHSSISRFRAANSKRIKRWLKDFNAILSELGLFGKEEVAVDGVLLKAVNSKKNNFTQSRLNKRQEAIQAEIDGYLRALEQSEEQERASAVEQLPNEIEDLQSKLAELEKAKKHNEQMLERAKQSPTGQLSLVDEDARLIKKKTSPGTAQVGYLAQSAVDSKHHLIAAVEVTQEGNDRGQLTPMLEAACESMQVGSQEHQGGEEKKAAPPIRGLADGGYGSFQDIAAAEAAGFEPYVPLARRSKAQEKQGHFELKQFRFDAERDGYHCPGGQFLHRHSDVEMKGSLFQTYYHLAACRDCALKSRCTNGKYRKIKRHSQQEAIERMVRRMVADPQAYKRRAASVEHPFGSMMFWNEGRNLLCRGLDKAQAEFTLSALAYNIKRTVRVVGVKSLIEAIKERARRPICRCTSNFRASAAPYDPISAISAFWRARRGIFHPKAPKCIVA